MDRGGTQDWCTHVEGAITLCLTQNLLLSLSFVHLPQRVEAEGHPP